MKRFESLRRHPYRSGSAALVVLGIAAAEIAGYAQNPTSDPPEGSCVSPPAVSATYVEPGTNIILQTYTGINTTGILARGLLPAGAYGVQASFKTPEADAAEWDVNASDMTEASDVGRYALKMAIGSGDVQFAVRVVAPEGSALCAVAPEVEYIHLGTEDYSNVDGTLPWPNPINVVSNL